MIHTADQRLWCLVQTGDLDALRGKLSGKIADSPGIRRINRIVPGPDRDTEIR